MVNNNNGYCFSYVRWKQDHGMGSYISETEIYAKNNAVQTHCELGSDQYILPNPVLSSILPKYNTDHPQT